MTSAIEQVEEAKPSPSWASLSLGLSLIGQVAGFSLLAFMWASDWSHGEELAWVRGLVLLSAMALVSILASLLPILFARRRDFSSAVTLISSLVLAFFAARFWFSALGW